jgi:hypothetical protein
MNLGSGLGRDRGGIHSGIMVRDMDGRAERPAVPVLQRVRRLLVRPCPRIPRRSFRKGIDSERRSTRCIDELYSGI